VPQSCALDIIGRGNTHKFITENCDARKLMDQQAGLVPKWSQDKTPVRFAFLHSLQLYVTDYHYYYAPAAAAAAPTTTTTTTTTITTTTTTTHHLSSSSKPTSL
jgi:hypothetical protein